MQKPICVIKINNSLSEAGYDLDAVINGVQKRMEEKFADYYVLTVPSFSELNKDRNEPIQLQVFYDKDFTESNFAELKKMIAEEMKKLK